MDRKSFLQKIGICTGTTAVLGLFSKTPVHAAVIDNTKVQAADVLFRKESENTNLQTEVTQLNRSLQDIDIRFNATDAVPEWRERGADTWHPFDNFTFGFATTWTSGYTITGINTDGTSYDYPGQYYYTIENIKNYCDFISDAVYGPTGAVTATVSKAGYYSTGAALSNFVHRNVGDTIVIGAVYYFGDFNPLGN